MDTLLALVPEEDRVQYPALMGQSLFYLHTDLKHKILAIAEEDRMEGPMMLFLPVPGGTR